MSEITVFRRGGVLMPATDEDREAMRALPQDEAHRFKFTVAHNYAFFRKWWALAKWAFEHWHEDAAALEYRGQPVVRSFDAFRRDLTILAGFYVPVYGIDGSVQLQAKSLRWDKMSEEEFSQLYEATVGVVVSRVAGLEGKTPDEIAQLVEEAASFA